MLFSIWHLCISVLMLFIPRCKVMTIVRDLYTLLAFMIVGRKNISPMPTFTSDILSAVTVFSALRAYAIGGRNIKIFFVVFILNIIPVCSNLVSDLYPINQHLWPFHWLLPSTECPIQNGQPWVNRTSSYAKIISMCLSKGVVCTFYYLTW